MLPFTPEQFMGVFVAYNEAIWPAQAVGYALGFAAVALLFRRTRAAGAAIASILALMWLWTGIVYHALFFAPVNAAAYGFAALFAVEGVWLFASGISGRLQFAFKPRRAAWTGAAFLLYAALYPLIGTWAGHAYPALPMFAVTPCPVTIFSLGLLLLAADPMPRGLFVIPVVWSLIGGSAAVLLAMPQDWFLLAAGPIALAVRAFRPVA